MFRKNEMYKFHFNEHLNAQWYNLFDSMSSFKLQAALKSDSVFGSCFFSHAFLAVHQFWFGIHLRSPVGHQISQSVGIPKVFID